MQWPYFDADKQAILLLVVTFALCSWKSSRSRSASSHVAAMEANSMMGGANVTYRLADGERLKIVKCLPLENPSPRWSGKFQG